MPPVTPQDLFQPEPSQGALRRGNGQRVAALSLEFLRTLHVAMIEEFPEQAPDLLYRSGFEWGLQDMTRVNSELQKNMGGGNLDLWQMDARFILETWWTPHFEAGWGRSSFDLTGAARGIVSIRLEASAVATALAGSEEPVCHLYAGLYAGAVSFFERLERHGIEIECRAAGGGECRFVVGPGPDVDSAETWRQQGKAPTEILRQLGAAG